MFFYVVECFSVIWKISRRHGLERVAGPNSISKSRATVYSLRVAFGESAHQVDQIGGLCTRSGPQVCGRSGGALHPRS